MPGQAETHFGKGKGDILASSWVQKGLENNEARCYSTDKVSKARGSNELLTSHSINNVSKNA